MRWARPARGLRGQAVLEVALLVPVLVGLLAGIVTFGRVYAAYQTVAVASHDGARVAATGGSAAEVRQTVLEALQAAELEGGATVSVNTPAATGEPVTVEVAVCVANGFPLPGVPDPVTVVKRTVMRRE